MRLQHVDIAVPRISLCIQESTQPPELLLVLWDEARMGADWFEAHRDEVYGIFDDLDLHVGYANAVPLQRTGRDTRAGLPRIRLPEEGGQVISEVLLEARMSDMHWFTGFRRNEGNLLIRTGELFEYGGKQRDDPPYAWDALDEQGFGYSEARVPFDRFAREYERVFARIA